MTFHPDAALLEEEAVAIIGIGCRFPGGANSPQNFWKLLCQGFNAIVDVPKERWDTRKFYDQNLNKPGKTYMNKGGFLQEPIDRFDPFFFDISPREAMSMDPQQRLLLEVNWEAIEDAGLTIEQLQLCQTGVFIGGFCYDHKLIQLNPLNRENFDSHTATSASPTLLANRISYVLDLKGPSMVVDTACSSSLVAAHLACRSLKNHDCDLAIVGGVNVMTTPEYPIAMAKGKLLSRRGYCSAFDEQADGYVRGEGCGIIILKPLKNALLDNNKIYALIKETGVNQDGRTVGITSPNSHAQVNLIAKVYSRAGITPEKIHYVEAHGTGTQAGDKAEAEALHAIFSDGKRTEKCIIGSVKTNIGHLEAAAGIASLIKTALCLKHKKIPPHLHFTKPNPSLSFANLMVRLPNGLESFPPSEVGIYAGVNSFGYGGTNAHALLQEFNQLEPKAKQVTSKLPFIFPISARSVEALNFLAKKYYQFLTEDGEGKNVSLHDFCYSAATKRTHHEVRRCVVTDSKDELINSLLQLAQGTIATNVCCAQSDHRDNEAKKLIFVYSGMGPQWWAMGRELLEHNPIFAASLKKSDEIFKKYSGWSLLDEFKLNEHHSRMEKTEVAQPANLAIQIALTALLKAWGVIPTAVMGHSIGEVAAAYVSGALSQEDALLIAYHRSRLQSTFAGQGGMMAVGLSAIEADKLIKDYPHVSIAAINSPSFVTLAGEKTTLENMAKFFSAKSIFNRMLRVEIAYHSYQMEVIKNELLLSLQTITPNETHIPFFSTVTGSTLDGKQLTAEYWWENVRQPVNFAQTIQSSILEKHGLFLEISPHPILVDYIRDIAHQLNDTVSIVASLKRGYPEFQRLAEMLGNLYVHGYNLKWDNFLPAGQYIQLPTYAWQKNIYWAESKRTREDRLGLSGHVYLNYDLRQPQPAWEIELNENFFPYLSDHCLDDAVVFPGAAYVEAGLALNEKIYAKTECTLIDIKFKKMLIVEKENTQKLNFNFDNETQVYSVWSSIAGDDPSWSCHATGKILPLTSRQPTSLQKLIDIKQKCNQAIDVNQLYANLTTMGLKYGTFFRIINRAWKGKNAAEMLIKIQPHCSAINNNDSYFLHPTILDSSFQAFVMLDNKTSKPLVPISIEKICFYTRPANDCWAHIEVGMKGDNFIEGNITIFDNHGELVCLVEKLRCQTLYQTKQVKQPAKFHRVRWVPSELINKLDKEKVVKNWVIFTDQDEISQKLVEILAAKKINYTLVKCANTYQQISTNDYLIRPHNEEDITHLFSGIKNQNILTLYLWGLDDSYSLETAQFNDMVNHCNSLSVIARSLDRLSRTSGKNLDLIIVTRGAQIITNEEQGNNLDTTVLWGMGQLIENELEYINCKLIDLSVSFTTSETDSLVNEILSQNNDHSIGLRTQQRFIQQIVSDHLIANESNLNTQLTVAEQILINQNATYLIVGGTQGLGLELANWLSNQGAGCLVLISRRGITTDAIQQTIATMRAQGTQIIIESLDITNSESVKQLIEKIHCELPPLHGLFHCAMVLDDGLMIDLNKNRYATVMAPKILGALNLHQYTKNIPLDFFISFSSIASLIGNRGQANYIAANSFLDAFAYYRQAQGLPATTINLGVLADTGVATRNQQLFELFEHAGIKLLSNKDLVTMLNIMLSKNLTQIGMFDMDWQKWAKVNYKLARASRFKEVILDNNMDASKFYHVMMVKLLGLDKKEQLDTLNQVVTEELAKVLRCPVEKIDITRSINKLGIESLMVVELHNALLSRLGVTLGFVELLKGLSVLKISEQLLLKAEKMQKN